MKVVWTEPAEDDRERIIFFIAQNNPQAAVAMDKLFTSCAESLVRLSARTRPGRIPNTREAVVHKNYILVFGIDEATDTIYITAVLHSSRQWPPE